MSEFDSSNFFNLNSQFADEINKSKINSSTHHIFLKIQYQNIFQQSLSQYIMKLKRTLPSIITQIQANKFQGFAEPSYIERQKTPIQIQPFEDDEPKLQDTQLIEKYLKKRPKIFTYSKIEEQVNSTERQIDDEGEQAAFSSNHSEVGSNEKQSQRKTIFQRRSSKKYPGPNITSAYQGKMQAKVQMLENLVDNLRGRLEVSRQKNDTSLTYELESRIQYLQRMEKIRQAELRKVNLELEQYQRCEKISKENEMLYGKLVQGLRVDLTRKSREASLVARGVLSESLFPSYEKMPYEDEEDDQRHEIYSPLYLDSNSFPLLPQQKQPFS